ncbi:MAG: NAD(P)(+) transhydrogenase (Re/Si-specific) subunit beta [Verrucomicrobiota bacterium]|nr:MAG: NAD(P)(+) transhydrogenase (Re/Si-specific) subunit beta [Verrucomicrobiota bacterium]
MSSVSLAYLLASICFILGTKLMGRMETAVRGNLLSALGMLIAAIASWVAAGGQHFQAIAIVVAIGGLVGGVMAVRVAMTQMPQMVALFNGFGGLASYLVGACELRTFASLLVSHSTRIATVASIIIGGITFSGSMIAYLKLRGGPTSWLDFLKKTSWAALLLSLVLLLSGSLGAVAVFLLLLPLCLGILITIRIGGGDMPVVIALLNSLSGLAASATGFMIANNALIIAGCLVGTSGLILTIIMCRAMNRSLRSVLWGSLKKNTKITSEAFAGEPRLISPEDAYYLLEAARKVIFVPGYGMAVSQAQYALKELADLLKNNGATVQYAIHPVAGRMPGHMNVLLAEANIPYDDLSDLETINREMSEVDVALIIGANDVVNPAAIEDHNSPIYGMPIIEVSRARNVLILKRGSGMGFSGLPNALFYKPNAAMIYGDAKATLSAISAEFK